MRRAMTTWDRLMSHTLCPLNARRCWEWQGYVGKNGYGYLTVRKRGHLTHRLSYEIFVGPIPLAVDVCHYCDNRICVNPSHLWIGTRQQNQADMAAKARSALGERNGAAKLTRDDILAIRNATGLQREIADRFGIQQVQVSRIKSRARWGHVP